jgi:hypothetical protein
VKHRHYGPFPTERLEALLRELEEKHPQTEEEELKIIEHHGFKVEPSGRLYIEA